MPAGFISLVKCRFTSSSFSQQDSGWSLLCRRSCSQCSRAAARTRKSLRWAAEDEADVHARHARGRRRHRLQHVGNLYDVPPARHGQHAHRQADFFRRPWQHLGVGDSDGLLLIGAQRDGVVASHRHRSLRDGRARRGPGNGHGRSLGSGAPAEERGGTMAPAGGTTCRATWCEACATM